MNWILCGMPKAGKTTVGKSLAKKLGCSFYDSDLLLEALYLRRVGVLAPCKSIYQEWGEKRFRDLEEEALAEFSPPGTFVLSLGGGALERSANQIRVKTLGKVCYLEASLELIQSRICENALPAYLDESQWSSKLVSLYSKRAPLFLQTADRTISTDGKRIEEIVEEFLNG